MNTTLTKEQIDRLQRDLVAKGFMTEAERLTGPGIFGPRTTAAYSKMVAATEAHPAIKEQVVKYGNLDQALAATNGNPMQVQNQFGQPFSQADQDAAYAEADAALSPYYQAEATKDAQDIEASLAEKQGNYDSYLRDAGQSFGQDKIKQDQTAADNGVLFSGGRAQKLRDLKNTYDQDQYDKQRSLTADVGQASRDYAYKQGTPAAQSLSKYYSANSNTYDPNVATGGVGSGGLSSLYNPNASNFQGTKVNTAKAAKEQRAAGLLWNKGNKLVASGLSNTYNR